MKREKEVYLYVITIYDENDRIKDVMNVNGKTSWDAFHNYELIKGRVSTNDSYSTTLLS